MISRRDFLQVVAATAAVTGLGGRLGRAAARDAVRQDDLLRFAPKGQVTLLHMADCHAQLQPIYFREPSLNLGVGLARGQPPHLVGQEFLSTFGVPEASLDAYMLTATDFETLAKAYGRVGGMDRVATVVRAIRAQRGAERVLLLDGGDTLQGSYTALATRGSARGAAHNGSSTAAVDHQMDVEQRYAGTFLTTPFPVARAEITRRLARHFRIARAFAPIRSARGRQGREWVVLAHNVC